MMHFPPPPSATTDDQIRAYGEQCANAAREEEMARCVDVCDNVARNYTKQYELGAKECAAAIRKG